MEDKPQPIKGYRSLTAKELELINEVKEHAEHTRELVNRVEHYILAQDSQAKPDGYVPHSTVTHPMRWAALARTDLQTGYMALTRAIAQPTTF